MNSLSEGIQGISLEPVAEQDSLFLVQSQEGWRDVTDILRKAPESALLRHFGE